MNVVRSAIPGIRARSFARSARMDRAEPPRRIAFSSRSDACWSGMSRYFTIFGSAAMTSISSSGKVARVGVVEPDPADAVDPAERAAGGRGAGPSSRRGRRRSRQVLRDQVELDRPLRGEPRASATMSAIGRDRCGPRSFGMMQKAQASGRSPRRP